MRKPANSFGASPKPKELPALRRTDLESKLCAAIKDRVRFRFKYRDDFQFRIAEPLAVYHSETDISKIMVHTIQISNPAEPFEKSGRRDFEVGRITALEITADKFIPDPKFDRNARKFRNGIICSV